MALGDSVSRDTLPQTKYGFVGTKFVGRAFYNTSVLKGVIPKHVVKLLLRQASQSLDVYEFGVYTGSRMKWINEELGMTFGHLWGFDSFVGFPDIDEGGGAALVTKLQGSWKKGRDSASAALGITSASGLIQFLRERIGAPRNGSTTFIQGYYNESLTPSLLQRHTFQPALFVDLDCDLHSSTMEAYRWMFESRLIVPGTVVRYDDWPKATACTGDSKSANWCRQKAGSCTRLDNAYILERCCETCAMEIRKRQPGRPTAHIWGQRLSHQQVTRQYGLQWTELFLHDGSVGGLQQEGELTSRIVRLDAINSSQPRE